jgi:hypothetical protein
MRRIVLHSATCHVVDALPRQPVGGEMKSEHQRSAPRLALGVDDGQAAHHGWPASSHLDVERHVQVGR